MKHRDEFVELVFMGLMIVAFMALVSGLSGCSSQTIEHAPTYRQIIWMREGYANLTHHICVEKNWYGGCELYNTKEYDLNDSGVRKTLIDLGFVCEIAGRRFKIDPDNAGFARYETKKSCFLFICGKEKTEITERVQFSDTRYLLDSGTYCYSDKERPGGIPE